MWGTFLIVIWRPLKQRTVVDWNTTEGKLVRRCFSLTMPSAAVGKDEEWEKLKMCCESETHHMRFRFTMMMAIGCN